MNGEPKEKTAIVEQTAEHAKAVLSRESSGHDWWHVYRVWKTAIRICTEENADPFVVQLAALLHDIADWKFHGGDEKAGPHAARVWLEQLQVDESVVAHVCQIIEDLSFRGAGVNTPMKTLEGMVVQDADRLDALGAVGIARAFAYGGHKGQEIHDPHLPPQYHSSFDQYKNSTGTTINHFYEKLLLLRDLMNTGTGKAIARERHLFLQSYLERFFLEWEGAA